MTDANPQSADGPDILTTAENRGLFPHPRSMYTLPDAGGGVRGVGAHMDVVTGIGGIDATAEIIFLH
jgi:hypothetical protein